MFHWFRLRHLWVVAALVLGVVAVILAGGGSSGKAQPTSSQTAATHPTKPAATVPAPTEPNPSATQAFKAQVDSRAKAFVVAYYSVSPPKGVTDVDKAIELSTENAKHAVQPYATAQFMATANFGYTLYGSPADDQMVKSHAAIIAEPASGLIDVRKVSAKEITGTVMIDFSKADDYGSYDLGTKPQLLTLTKQGDTWFVDSAPLT
jgi:hypothetical protein